MEIGQEAIEIKATFRWNLIAHTKLQGGDSNTHLVLVYIAP
jgi:hypothetical protein